MCSGWIYRAASYHEHGGDYQVPNESVYFSRQVLTVDGIKEWLLQDPAPEDCHPKGAESDFAVANLETVFNKWSSDPENPPPPPPRAAQESPFFACRDGHYEIRKDGLAGDEPTNPTTLEDWDLEQLAADFRARTGAPDSAQPKVLAWRVLEASGGVPSGHLHLEFVAAEYPSASGSGPIWALATMERSASVAWWSAPGDFVPSTGRGPVACVDERPSRALLHVFLEGAGWNNLESGAQIRVEGTVEEAWGEITGEVD